MKWSRRTDSAKSPNQKQRLFGSTLKRHTLPVPVMLSSKRIMDHGFLRFFGIRFNQIFGVVCACGCTRPVFQGLLSVHRSVLTCEKTERDILFSLPVSVLEVFSLVPCSDRRPVCFVRCRTPARKPDLSFRRIFGSSASKWFRCSFFTKQLKRQFNRFFLSVTAGTNNGLKTTLCSGAASVFSSPACRSAYRNSGRGANENHWIREQFVLLGYLPCTD